MESKILLTASKFKEQKQKKIERILDLEFESTYKKSLRVADVNACKIDDLNYLAKGIINGYGKKSTFAVRSNSPSNESFFLNESLIAKQIKQKNNNRDASESDTANFYK
jgi:hypothetical protein